MKIDLVIFACVLAAGSAVAYPKPYAADATACIPRTKATGVSRTPWLRICNGR